MSSFLNKIAARKYVWDVLYCMLDAELSVDNLGKLEGWVFGGKSKDDVKLLVDAIERIKCEIAKKAG